MYTFVLYTPYKKGYSKPQYIQVQLWYFNNRVKRGRAK